jgi:hypothetical protein
MQIYKEKRNYKSKNANIKGKTLICHDNANLKGKTLKSHDNANLKGKTQI